MVLTEIAVSGTRGISRYVQKTAFSLNPSLSYQAAIQSAKSSGTTDYRSIEIGTIPNINRISKRPLYCNLFFKLIILFTRLKYFHISESRTKGKIQSGTKRYKDVNNL